MYSSWMMMGRVRGALAALAMFTGTIACTGCMQPGFMGGEVKKGPPPPPMGPAEAMTTYWDKEIQQAPDPTHGYQMTPCFVGRMILYGPTKMPVCCEGSAVVTLYHLNAGPNGAPVVLEQWNIDKDNLKKMIYKDQLAWGYTLALPTAAYRPDMKQVLLDVTFVPADKEGYPVTARSGTMNMGTGSNKSYRFTNPVMPASYYVAPTQQQQGVPMQMPVNGQPQIPQGVIQAGSVQY